MTTNGNGVWKWVSGLLAALILGMAVQAMREPKDLVSEKELTKEVVQLQGKIDTLANEVSALRTTVNQQNTDLARIAEHVGVTAHPVIAPSSRPQ